MKFIITAETTDSYSPVSDISRPLWAEYCDRHGYEFSVRNVVESERGPVWERVPHMQEKLKECDWVVHVDLDAIPTNMAIPLTNFIDDRAGICIPKVVNDKGYLVFNDGFLMASNTVAGHGCLSYAWDNLNKPEEKIFCLQDALQWMYVKEGGNMIHYFKILDQKKTNCFLYGEYGLSENCDGQWEIGDYILHCPGMNTEKRVELLTRYKEEIIR